MNCSTASETTSLALKNVRESDLSLGQVAFLLGYANQPAFSLAFRHWIGTAPSELRRPQLQRTPHVGARS